MAKRDLNGGGYGGETYYGQPGLKSAPWDWTVSGYIYLAGLAGGAQMLAAIAQGLDRRLYRGVIRNARYLATTGTVIGAMLLIADLRTPQRWYNMLRILRPTSPMSFGTYILGAFGGLSGLTALGELLRGLGTPGRLARKIADLAQLPAAITGAGASTYTASLMSATSTPYWAAVPRHLGASFATASMATGAAALSLLERLAGRDASAQRLDDVAAAATVAHLAVSASQSAEQRRRGIPEDVEQTRAGQLYKSGDIIIAGAIPLAAYALNRATGGRSPALSAVGSIAILAGGYMMRHGLLYVGRKSSESPEAYFRFAQPRNLPGRHHGSQPATRRGDE